MLDVAARDGRLGARDDHEEVEDRAPREPACALPVMDGDSESAS
jgi:hypothetical protein